MQTKKITSFMFFFIALSLLLGSCSDPPKKVEKKVEFQQDNVGPVLDDITPADGERLGDTPVPSVEISGLISDDSRIEQMTINGKDVSLTQTENTKVYSFKTTIDLLPGENVIKIAAQDQYGNQLPETEIIYINGNAPRIIVEPERRELPPQGKTFLEIILEENGERTPLQPEEVELRAQLGEIRGPEYQAPSQSGTDTITAKLASKNAQGRAKILVRAPRIKGSWTGDDVMQIGQAKTYSMAVENIGENEAHKTLLIVKLPDFLTPIDLSSKVQHIKVTNQIRWKLGTLGPGVSEVVKFKVGAKEDKKGKFIISLETAGEEVYSESKPIRVIGELDVIHKCNRGIAQLEKDLLMTVVVKAHQNVSNVKLIYNYPVETKFVEARSDAPTEEKTGYALSGSSVSYTPIPSLSKGQTATFTVRTLVKRFGKLKHTAQIKFTGDHGQKEIEKVLVISTAE